MRLIGLSWPYNHRVLGHEYLWSLGILGHGFTKSRYFLFSDSSTGSVSHLSSKREGRVMEGMQVCSFLNI
jgi:hypothetical protein